MNLDGKFSPIKQTMKMIAQASITLAGGEKDNESVTRYQPREQLKEKFHTRLSFHLKHLAGGGGGGGGDRTEAICPEPDTTTDDDCCVPMLQKNIPSVNISSSNNNMNNNGFTVRRHHGDNIS